MRKRAGDYVLGRGGDPIGDAEGAVLGEVSVVEAEDEVAFAGAHALQRVAVAAREIPGVAGAEIGDLALAVGHDDGGAAAAFQHVGPLGGERVPVELADGAGLQPHGDAGDALRDGELGDRGFLGRSAFALPACAAFDVVLEIGDRLDLGFLRRRRGVGRRGRREDERTRGHRIEQASPADAGLFVRHNFPSCVDVKRM